MEKRHFIITIHHEESQEERNRREAAERREARFWYAAAVLVLLLLALCWKAVEARGTREAETTEEPAAGPVVQMLQLDQAVSKPEKPYQSGRKAKRKPPNRIRGTLFQTARLPISAQKHTLISVGPGTGLRPRGARCSRASPAPWTLM